LLRGFDVSHAVRVQRERAGEDDEIHHDVREKCADSNIEFSIVDFLSRHAFTLPQHSATHRFVFLTSSEACQKNR